MFTKLYAKVFRDQLGIDSGTRVEKPAWPVGIR
jgi:hypothetical protein